MLQRTRSSGLVLGAFVLSLAMCCALASAQTKPFVTMVPDDVMGFASVRNYRELANKLQATPYGKMLAEPEVKALMDRIAGALSKQLGEFEKAAGLKPADIEKMLSGEIAMATVSKGRGMATLEALGARQRSESWVLVLVDVGQNSQEASKLVDRLVQRAAQEKNVQVGDEEFRGHKIKRLTIKSEASAGMTEEQLNKLDPDMREQMKKMQAEQAAAMKPTQVYINLEKNILAVSMGQDRGLFEKHLILRDGGDVKPLSAGDLYKQIIGRVDPQSDYIAYQNFKPIWDAVEAQGKEMEKGEGLNMARVFESLGIFNLKAEIGSVMVQKDGISGSGFVLAPSPRTGVLKAFVPTAAAPKVQPPSFVSDDAALYLGAYFDMPALWTEIKAAIQKFSPENFQAMEQQFNDPSMPFHPERDFINTLGNQWFVYVPKEVVVGGAPAAPGTAPAPTTINLILAADVKDPAKLEGSIKKLLAMAPPESGIGKPVQFMGKDIYKIPLSEMMPFLPMENTELSISLIFVGNKLFIATSDAMAKLAVRDSALPESKLSAKREYREAMQRDTLNQPSMIWYMDYRSVGKWAFALVKKFVPEEKLHLPAYEVFEKYLYVAGGTAKWDEQGLVAKSWAPFAPAK